MPTSSSFLQSGSRPRWAFDEQSNADRRALLNSLDGPRPSQQQPTIFPGRPWLVPKHPSPSGFQTVERAAYRTELVAPRSVNQGRRLETPPALPSPSPAHQLDSVASPVGYVLPAQPARPGMSHSRESGDGSVERKPVPEFGNRETRSGVQAMSESEARRRGSGQSEAGAGRASSSGGMAVGGDGADGAQEVEAGAQERQAVDVDGSSSGERETTDGGRSGDDDDLVPMPGSLSSNARRPSLPVFDTTSATSFPRRSSLPIGLVPSPFSSLAPPAPSVTLPLSSPAFSNDSSDPYDLTASVHGSDEEGDDEIEELSMDEAAPVVERTSARLRREKRERNERRRAAKADKEKRKADRVRRAEEEKRAELEALEEEDRRVAQEIRERTRARAGRRGSAKSVESIVEVDQGAAAVSLAAGWRASMIEDSEAPGSPRSAFMEKFSSDSSARDSSDQEAVTSAESTTSLSSPSAPAFSTPVASPTTSLNSSPNKPSRPLSLLRRKSFSKEPTPPPPISSTHLVDTLPVFDEQIWTSLLNQELARDDGKHPEHDASPVPLPISSLTTAASSSPSSPELAHGFPSPPGRAEGSTPPSHDLVTSTPSIPARLVSSAGSLFRWGSTSRQINNSVAPHEFESSAPFSQELDPVLGGLSSGAAETCGDGRAERFVDAEAMSPDLSREDEDEDEDEDEEELEDELRRSSISTRSFRRRGESSSDFARAEKIAVEATASGDNTAEDPPQDLPASSSSSSGPPPPPLATSLPTLSIDSITHHPSLRKTPSTLSVHSPLERRSTTQAHEIHNFLRREEPPPLHAAPLFLLVSADKGSTSPADSRYASTPSPRHTSLPPGAGAGRVYKKRLSILNFLRLSKSSSSHSPSPIAEFGELSYRPSASLSLKTSTVKDEFGLARKASKKSKSRSGGTLRKINLALGSMMAFSDRLTGMEEQGEGKARGSPMYVARGSVTNGEILKMRQEGQYWDPSFGPTHLSR